MWKAELLKPAAKVGGNIVASVRFSADTGESFDQDIPGNALTPESLAAFCQRVCESREATDASVLAFSSVQPGPIVLPRDKP